MLNRAGGSQNSAYDDMAFLVGPQGWHSQEALLSLARYETIYLNEQFENGGDGTKFELENVIVPDSPTDGPESLKNGTGRVGIDIGVSNEIAQQQAGNPEFYRGHLVLKNNRTEDDFGAISDLALAMHKDGDALFTATNEIMDVDLWMRLHAAHSHLGHFDTYGIGNPRNLRIYARPVDGKIIPFLWDCDNCGFQGGYFAKSSNVSRLDEIRDIPHNLRLYWGHLLDLINRSFNEQYVAIWADHYGQLVSFNVALTSGTRFFRTFPELTRKRTELALREINAAIPPIDFQITTKDGLKLNSEEGTVTLEGKGWINVRRIRLAGSGGSGQGG